MTTQIAGIKKKNFGLFDNKLNKKVKPVMKDAWTQTTPREEHKRRRRERE